MSEDPGGWLLPALILPSSIRQSLLRLLLSNFIHFSGLSVHCSHQMTHPRMKVKVLFAQSCPTLCNPMDGNQGPLSMGFSRQEYWSRLSFPSPGNLPNPGIKPRSPALQAHSLTSEPPGKHLECPNGGKLKDMYLPCFQEGFAIVQSLGQDLA